MFIERAQRSRIAVSLVAVTAVMLSVMVATTGTADAQLDNSWTELAGTAACISGDTVQSDPAAADLSLGQTFVGQDGNRFTITNGKALCDFSGADCAEGLQLHVVSHVKQCLASQSVPVTVVVDTVTDAGPSTLAYTGSETTLAMAGVTLLGAGALLEAGRRKRERS